MRYVLPGRDARDRPRDPRRGQSPGQASSPGLARVFGAAHRQHSIAAECNTPALRAGAAPGWLARWPVAGAKTRNRRKRAERYRDSSQDARPLNPRPRSRPLATGHRAPPSRDASTAAKVSWAATFDTGHRAPSSRGASRDRRGGGGSLALRHGSARLQAKPLTYDPADPTTSPTKAARRKVRSADQPRQQPHAVQPRRNPMRDEQREGSPAPAPRLDRTARPMRDEQRERFPAPAPRLDRTAKLRSPPVSRGRAAARS